MLPTTVDLLKSVLRADPTLSPSDRALLLARMRQPGQASEAVPGVKSELRLIRRSEAARRLACSLRTIDKLAAAGVLPKRKLPGRVRASGFLASDLDALLLTDPPGPPRWPRNPAMEQQPVSSPCRLIRAALGGAKAQ